MGTFPARVLCVPGGVCVAGSRGLLKLSQPGRSWQAWKILASLVPGAGGYVFERITAVSGALYFVENNGISAAWTIPIFCR